ncbi:addiction module protein [Flavobacterium sp. J372]|uniref:addiction module protein n=1 Tax=Flavobacterium sp. J372 TaxID=2898436 RepID=UPI002150A0D9|nr:addiction module protein [Flavobacterium sp. J372]MCR5861273.1 addiction module protein [Flavobacterium sp. J372]
MDSVNLNIRLNLDQLLQAVKQLSPKDKLKVNDAIWDDSTDIPKAHQQLVMSRIEAAKQDPNRMLDWDEVAKFL